jgi:hypothetical protein
LWGLKLEDGYEDFLKTLNREVKPQISKEALDGIRFENVLNEVLDGALLPEDHEWYEPLKELARSKWIKNAQSQVKLSKDITINGINFRLFGVLDFLKAGVITDTKFSKRYHRGKYLKSPQHSMYFALVPEAYRFDYKISDGKYVYTESYFPEDTPSIETLIKEFVTYLKAYGLWDTYTQKWEVAW